MQSETRIPLLTLSNKASNVGGCFKDNILSEMAAPTHKTTCKDSHSSEIVNPKSTRKTTAEEIAANKEYIITLKNALREVIEENEAV